MSQESLSRLSPRVAASMLAGYLDRELREPVSELPLVLDACHRFLELYLDKDQAAPAAELDRMETIIPPTPDVKPTTHYELGESLQRGARLGDGEDVPDVTFTVKEGDDKLKTVLSTADTKKILRGEPSASFEPRFLDAVVGNFFGRPIVEWSEAGDRLVVLHH